MNEEIKQGLKEIKQSVIVMMKNVWSVSDLALVLNISESRVRHMAADNLFPSYKQNGSLYFKREEIEAWQTRNRTASKDEINKIAATYIATKRL
ncbi:MAG: helix-turn-helix domain-containing protein [Bacteroidales bacterium]|nr:helix-turn-helix domain-containing protein [Bacteroidales bacterium]